VDKARSRAEGGHGLGLAIAKWSIEHQTGSVEVESELGKGSVFRIKLLLLTTGLPKSAIDTARGEWLCSPS
jgi:signal transduction histidine kinase